MYSQLSTLNMNLQTLTHQSGPMWVENPTLWNFIAKVFHAFASVEFFLFDKVNVFYAICKATHQQHQNIGKT